MTDYIREDGAVMADFALHMAVNRRIGERIGLIHRLGADEPIAPPVTVLKTGAVGKTMASLPAIAAALSPVAPTMLPARLIRTVRALRALDMSDTEIVAATGAPMATVASILQREEA